MHAQLGSVHWKLYKLTEVQFSAVLAKTNLKKES
jgi:hypothetical protein